MHSRTCAPPYPHTFPLYTHGAPHPPTSQWAELESIGQQKMQGGGGKKLEIPPGVIPLLSADVAAAAHLPDGQGVPTIALQVWVLLMLCQERGGDVCTCVCNRVHMCVYMPAHAIVCACACMRHHSPHTPQPINTPQPPPPHNRVEASSPLA